MCLHIIKGASKTVSRKSALTPNLPQENSAGAQPGAKLELLATNITRNKLFLILKKKTQVGPFSRVGRGRETTIFFHLALWKFSTSKGSTS